MIVKETIYEFERGKDPKITLGIGLFIPHKFNEEEEAADFIYNNLAGILQMEKIPDDIIKTYGNAWYLREYYEKLRKYINEYLSLYEKRRIYVEHTLGLVHDKLLANGYKKN
jgi:hypothetical protein